MTPRVLVAYASRFGSTAEVAAAIGEALALAGLAVDVRPVAEAPSPGAYQAVVLGSAVQYGKWLAEAVQFAESHRQALAALPVALFCVHITNTGDDETSRKARLAYLDEARAFVQPVSEAFFSGKFDRRGAALLLPRLLAAVVPTMDRRNWDQIRRWGQSLAALTAPQPAP